MGGKSVAVKTALLNVCLCHMGFYVFALSAKIPLFDDLCLISEDSQSTENGLSTFGAEIVKLNTVLEKVGEEYLFIVLDEFARSTNPEEGAAIVRASAKYLNMQRSISVITTHYDRIAEEGYGLYQVAGLKGVDFGELAKRIKSGTVNGVDLIADNMDYRIFKITKDSEPQRDALNICRMLGLHRGVLEAINLEY
jgi:dsDNA-specific endonuclease/ATPase MutS2